MKKFIIAFLIIVLSLELIASPIVPKLRWATDEWAGYTNRDGTGLYHELLSEIFGSQGFNIEVTYVPWNRALFMVDHHMVDITGGEVRNTSKLQSKEAIATLNEQVLFRKDDFPRWVGIQSLIDRKGVWYRGYSIPEQFQSYFKGQQVNSRRQALKIFKSKRGIEYYLDNKDQMLQNIANEPEKLKQQWQIEPLYTAQIYWRFQQSERGEYLKKIYDEGFARMYCSGALTALYIKWNEPLPPISFECKNDLIDF